MAERIPPERVLEHPFRRVLLDAIRGEPGIAFLDLYDRFRRDPTFGPGIGYGSLTHHLARLERARHIVTRRSGRHRRHYANGGPWTGHLDALAVLQTSTANALACIVVAWPGLSVKEVWERVCESRPRTRQAVGYELERMARMGLVAIVPDGSRRLHHATRLLKRLLAFAPASREPPAAGAACVECSRSSCVVALMPGEACPCTTPGCRCHGPVEGCCRTHATGPPSLFASTAPASAEVVA